MLRWWRARRRRRDLVRFAPAEEDWSRVLATESALAHLEPNERDELRDLAALIMAEKTFLGAAGFAVGRPEATRVAALAALPILRLGLEWYRGWHTVVLYPTGFLARHQEEDEIGVVHDTARDLSGEAWEGGPIVLSWEDVIDGGAADGHNVVLHEFAHKLDMLDGASNGRPPLHPGMDPAAWASAFTAAFDDLSRRIAGNDDAALDPYAAEAPEEFFAVATEAFFERPLAVREAYPAVYAQLAAFYRQDPARRHERH